MRPGLRVGDEIRLRDPQETRAKVVLLTGSVVTALLDDGEIVALSFGEFYDKTGDGEPPRLTPQKPVEVGSDELSIAKELAIHLIEVKTGIRPGKDLPRPGYEPGTTSVGERELRKVSEFAELSENHPWAGMALSTLRLYRKRYKDGGTAALIDGRSTKRKAPYGRQQETLVKLISDQIREQADDATVSLKTFYRRVQRRVDEFNAADEHAENQLVCPSMSTVSRIVKGMPEARYAFTDSTRRRSNNSSPDSGLTPFFASRPGDQVQIDSTKLNCWVRSNSGDRKFRPELTVALDLATRSVLGYRLTEETSNAIDTAEVLAKILTPEPFRDGWEDRLRYNFESVPLQRALDLDERLKSAARVPVIFPNNIIIDNGRSYVSRVFFEACERFGISIHQARPATGHDKGNVERFFRSLDSRFLEHVKDAYTARAVHLKGRKLPDVEALYTLQQLDDFFAEFVLIYQDLPHKGLSLPWAEDMAVSPNTMYEFLVGAHGYLPAPASFSETIDVLPEFRGKIHSYGVEHNGRLFDSDVLNDYRNLKNRNSKDGKYLFRYHTGETRFIYFYDDDHDTVFAIPWTRNEDVNFEFSETAWKAALDAVAKSESPQMRQSSALIELQDTMAAGGLAATLPRKEQHVQDVASAAVEVAEAAPPPEVFDEAKKTKYYAMLEKKKK